MEQKQSDCTRNNSSGDNSSPRRSFSHIHVDIVGPLPVSSTRCRCLLTIVDRLTIWPEAVPLTDITAEVCADSFTSHWVERFGVPGTMTTDRVTQFSGAVLDVLVQHSWYPAHHDHRISSAEQWPRGEVSLEAEGGSAG